jgi:hypothetical protein
MVASAELALLLVAAGEERHNLLKYVRAAHALGSHELMIKQTKFYTYLGSCHGYWT